jgi:hypothetical protein
VEQDMTDIPLSSQQVRTIEAVRALVPEAVSATAHECGQQGVKAFFDGYKDSIDLHKQAA